MPKRSTGRWHRRGLARRSAGEPKQLCTVSSSPFLGAGAMPPAAAVVLRMPISSSSSRRTCMLLCVHPKLSCGYNRVVGQRSLCNYQNSTLAVSVSKAREKRTLQLKGGGVSLREELLKNDEGRRHCFSFP
ncbi:uncharacterized protein LOC119363883 [Triticum dicoccoides]|uniref:uncharacterized protein LOC119363883 n=1 Tax=Triticum dicoccoides TaxID=85692 RepID=UPI00189020AA|nr:uncharacterized protein LOC119363883 [Triticum dicoccoides]